VEHVHTNLVRQVSQVSKEVEAEAPLAGCSFFKSLFLLASGKISITFLSCEDFGCTKAWVVEGLDAGPVNGEGLSWNWMILLGHRRLQYIGEETLGVAGG
jgi:hypothetical protein